MAAFTIYRHCEKAFSADAAIFIVAIKHERLLVVPPRNDDFSIWNLLMVTERNEVEAAFINSIVIPNPIAIGSIGNRNAIGFKIAACAGMMNNF